MVQQGRRMKTVAAATDKALINPVSCLVRTLNLFQFCRSDLEQFGWRQQAGPRAVLRNDAQVS